MRSKTNVSQDAFYEEFNEAKAAVQEPPQPKIKLRTPSAAQPPPPGPGKPKRITIHVGGGREGSQESSVPTPGTSHISATPQPAVNGGASRVVPVNGPVANLSQVAPALPTPALNFKREDPVRQPPAIPSQMNNSYSASAFRPVMQPANGLDQPHHTGMANGNVPLSTPAPAPVAPVPQRSLLDVKYRPDTGPGTSSPVNTAQCLANIFSQPQVFKTHFSRTYAFGRPSITSTTTNDLSSKCLLTRSCCSRASRST